MDYVCQMHLAKQFTHRAVFRIPEHKRSLKGEASHILCHLSARWIWTHPDTQTAAAAAAAAAATTLLCPVNSASRCRSWRATFDRIQTGPPAEAPLRSPGCLPERPRTGRSPHPFVIPCGNAIGVGYRGTEEQQPLGCPSSKPDH